MSGNNIRRGSLTAMDAEVKVSDSELPEFSLSEKENGWTVLWREQPVGINEFQRRLLSTRLPLGISSFREYTSKSI